MMDDDDIIALPDERDGELHCPVSQCDIWYPDGMGYGFLEHFGNHDVCLICETELWYPGNEVLCLDCVE